MTRKEKTKREGDVFVPEVVRAVRRSARTARQVARMYGTPVYIWKDGKVVAEKP
jgi:hypothetical protein